MIDLFGPASFDGAVTARPADNRTFGLTDTWFRDCSDPALDDGTEFGAAFFNQLLANMRSIARGNGLTAAAADVVTQDNGADAILLQAIQHLFQRQQPIYADDVSGNANQVVVTLSPAPAELKRGMRVRIRIANDVNTSASLTVNGVAKAIKTVAGQDVQKGMLVAGQMANFDYDGAAWQLVSVSSERNVFTPRATISVQALASVPWGAWTVHGLAPSTSANLNVAVGASDFQLPAGVYLFIGRVMTTTQPVVNATQVAQMLKLAINGVNVGQDMELTRLNAGQDVSSTRNMVCVANVAAADKLTVQSFLGTTYSADYSGGNVEAGSLNIIRIGN